MSAMRQETIDRIEALHAEIAKLIEEEKAHFFATQGRINDLWDSIHECGMEWYMHPPWWRNLAERENKP